MKNVKRDDDDILLSSPPEPRTRSDEAFTFPANYSSYVWNTKQVPKPVEPVPYCNCMRGTSRVMTDVVTPGFKRRSQAGSIINSPMSRTLLSLEIEGEAGCGFKSVDTSQNPIVTTTHEIKGLILPIRPMSESQLSEAIYSTVGNLITPDERSTAIGLASTASRGKIEQPSFTGLVSIGELGETLRYLRNPLKSGLALASKLERDLKMAGTSKRKGSTASAIASLYLEFRYAVRPMIFEVQKALDTIASMKLELNPLRKTARAYQVVTKNATRFTGDVDGGGFRYDVTTDIRHDLIVRCGFLYEIVDGIDHNDWWGMRLSDVPAAMWELTPLSFVYDWVGNVGDFISAVTPVAGTRQLSCWTTIEETREVILSGSNFRSNYANVQTTRNGLNRIRMTASLKSRHPSVNAPSLETRGLESLSNDALKLLDLIGIMKQKLDPLARKQEAFALEQQRASALDRRLKRFK